MTEPTIDRKRLVEVRESLGMSQMQAAVVVGVDRGTIQNWEKGRRAPSFTDAARLARAYGVTMESLLRWPEEDRQDGSATARAAVEQTGSGLDELPELPEPPARPARVPAARRKPASG